jgi:hypothetical protein
MNLRFAHIMETSQIHLEKNVEDELLRSTSEGENHIQLMLDQNRILLSSVTPFVRHSNA